MVRGELELELTASTRHEWGDPGLSPMAFVKILLSSNSNLACERKCSDVVIK